MNTCEAASTASSYTAKNYIYYCAFYVHRTIYHQESRDNVVSQDRIIQYKLEKWGHNPTSEHYLVFYKFGDRVFQAKDKEAAISNYTEELTKEINPK